MSMPNEYIVLGGDGREYGPVNVQQIHEWIIEERLEEKTPVKGQWDKDWVFLGSLPEFAEGFKRVAKARKSAMPSFKKKIWLLGTAVVIIVGVVLVALKQFKLH